MFQTEISIRPVEREEFDDWERLREAVYTGLSHEYHRKEMELMFENSEMECLLAVTKADVVCGMCEVTLHNIVDGCLSSPVGYIEGIFVDPGFRNIGVARKLVENAETWCRRRGCTEIGTDAEIDDEDAQRFHEYMGFEETYRVVEYKKRL